MKKREPCSLSQETTPQGNPVFKPAHPHVSAVIVIYLLFTAVIVNIYLLFTVLVVACAHAHMFLHTKHTKDQTGLSDVSNQFDFSNRFVEKLGYTKLS